MAGDPVVGLSYFWFLAAAVIGAMDLYFGNLFLLLLSSACFFTGVLAVLVNGLYFQISVFLTLSVFTFAFMIGLQYHREKVDFYSEWLKRNVGKYVTVHEWNGSKAKVQYDGRIWTAEIAFNPNQELKAGKYKIWKILGHRLILINV